MDLNGIIIKFFFEAFELNNTISDRLFFLGITFSQSSLAKIQMEPKKEKVIRKTHFSEKEDEMLVSLVQAIGIQKRVKFTSQLLNRNTRQVRERWYHYFDASINHYPWTPEENQA
jgi:hypothetical protein